MDLKIISDTENLLFNRREIEGEIHSDSVPSRAVVTKMLSEKFSVSPSMINIRTIKGKFGEKIFLLVANIYKSEKNKNEIETKKKKNSKAQPVEEEQGTSETSEEVD